MKRLFWLDLEMTGLNVQAHRILEVAAIITDLEFKNLGQYHAVVHQPKEIMDTMDDWCTRTHGESGLTAAVERDGKPLAEVEKEILKFASEFYTEDEKIVLVGNSIDQDKRFIEGYMKEFAERLHYRIIDVSSFKEIFKWKFGVSFRKENSHRAFTDIEESIKELETYCRHMSPKPLPQVE